MIEEGGKAKSPFDVILVWKFRSGSGNLNRGISGIAA